MFDILLSIKGELVWVCEIYESSVDDAITCALREIGKAEYVGHKAYKVINGAWAEVA